MIEAAAASTTRDVLCRNTATPLELDDERRATEI
jgi:hypothetical protein